MFVYVRCVNVSECDIANCVHAKCTLAYSYAPVGIDRYIYTCVYTQTHTREQSVCNVLCSGSVFNTRIVSFYLLFIDANVVANFSNLKSVIIRAFGLYMY